MHYLMGTFVEIEASGEKRSQVLEGAEAAFSEIRRLERILSKYDKESEIARVNETAHIAPLKISAETFTLLEEALSFSRLSEGAFDITVGAVLDLWNLAQKRGFLPMPDELEGACQKVGYSYIALDSKEGSILLDKPGITIDLGGIGKGYAIDRAIGILKQNAINKAIVNAGGNIFCLDEEPSFFGILNPLNTSEIIAKVALKNQAVSTSGNYERFFSVSGKKYGHILDPKTGYPSDKGVLSVSIISASAKLADILSTAVFVMGLDKGMDLIESLDDIEGLIAINNNSRIRLCTSSGLKEILPLTYSLN